MEAYDALLMQASSGAKSARSNAKGARPMGSVRLGFVYLVRTKTHVKIGYTTSPEDRLIRVAGGCPEPIRVVAVRYGTRSDEASLHRRFAAWRTSGEWFAIAGDVADWLHGGAKMPPMAIEYPLSGREALDRKSYY